MGSFASGTPRELTVSKADMTNLIGHPIGDEDNEGSITFNCAEQFMLYCKAGRFEDRATQQRILATSDPKGQKRLGKGVTGFYDAYWDEIKSEVVVVGTNGQVWSEQEAAWEATGYWG